MKKRLLILFLVILAGFGAGAGALFLQNATPSLPSGGNPKPAAVTDDVFGGPFTLTDHHGKTVTDKDYADQYRLIYFGFTYCPAICPTELSKMTTTLNQLGEKSRHVKPVFITVDPERDTVEKMASYVSLFHPSFTGLTGTPEQIAKTLKDYKIYAAKREDESMTEYTMDHSSFIYFIAPDGRLLHIFKIQDDADMMTQTISEWLSTDTP